MQRQKPEQRAEKVLSLRDPGNRLDVQGMHRKEHRHEPAQPDPARHPLEQREKTQRASDVERQARQMVTAGPEPIELNVQHVRKDRQRVPVSDDGGRQGPSHRLEAQPALHPQVVVHVEVVVVVDETMFRDGGVDKKGQHEKEGRDDGVAYAPRGSPLDRSILASLSFPAHRHSLPRRLVSGKISGAGRSIDDARRALRCSP